MIQKQNKFILEYQLIESFSFVASSERNESNLSKFGSQNTNIRGSSQLFVDIFNILSTVRGGLKIIPRS